MRIRRLIIAAMSLALLLFTAGCGSSKAETKVFSGEATVKMKNLAYDPKNITVEKGTKITFVNMDAMEHDVIQVAAKELGKVEPGWKSEIIAPGKNWSITLDKPGEYPILCIQYGHYTAGMIGKITVVD